MKTIYEMNPLVHRLLPLMQPEADVEYRPLAFCLQENVPEGLLVYNTLTKGLYLLDTGEKEAFLEKHPHSETGRKLVNEYCLVPQQHDDCRLSDEINGVVESIDNHRMDGKLNNYTILPTTDCNARCYYCYEAGCKRVDMTEEMAHRVAAYIERTHRSEFITINWFGGEPLCNTRVIDIVCEDLRKAGIRYAANMASNAYLFQEDMIQKAADLWNLKSIQVTLDGTEDVYNRTKAYIEPSGESPFRRVIRNILALIEHKVFVTIRLNVGEENYDDVLKLTDQLTGFLPGEGGYRIYAHLLFDIEQKSELSTRTKMTRLLQQLNEKIDAQSTPSRSGIKRDLRRWHCQATDGVSIVIDPEGNLYPCEHFNQCEHVGTIDRDEDKFKDIRSWQVQGKAEDQCAECACYPDCGRIERCPANPQGCIPAQRERMLSEFRACLKNEWEAYCKRSKIDPTDCLRSICP